MIAGTKMGESQKGSQAHMVLSIDVPITKTQSSLTFILTNLHAGYFRISLSLSSQALLWKILKEPIQDAHALRRVFSLMPSTAFTLLWSLSLLTLLVLSLLYLLRCFFHFDMVRDEFLNRVGVNYLYVAGLIAVSSPNRNLSPSTMVGVGGAGVGARFEDIRSVVDEGEEVSGDCGEPDKQDGGDREPGGSAGGWKESAVGMAHYVVLYATLYQRLSGEHGGGVPETLRLVLFLYIAAPSVASLAWGSICGQLDTASKMLFFLFMSLITRPMMFKKAMRRFNVAWWAYSLPLTSLALTSAQHAQEVKAAMPHALMLLLSSLFVLVSLFLMIVICHCSSCQLTLHVAPTQLCSSFIQDSLFL